ncbi:hypothetical protein [Streptomyces sp. NRRL S-118]|uniref:hypothetical protein n=1 Tax=Streptomyces sp. NRRL S-118 TaxID=1463881 RepID=UPI000A3F5412|nr:hypothetical protein [Streptomyces sp. NRRL S-118]
MGEFTYTPAPAALFFCGPGRRSWSPAERIALTWSTPVLEEFIEAMDRIEEDFERSWGRAGSGKDQGPSDGSA